MQSTYRPNPRATVAPLGDSVVNVVFLSPNKKMIRANTVSHITLVQNQKAEGDRTITHLPANSMGSADSPSSEVVFPHLNFSVSTFFNGACPQPATSCFINSGPQPLRNIFNFCHKHNTLLLNTSNVKGVTNV